MSVDTVKLTDNVTDNFNAIEETKQANLTTQQQ